MYSIILNWLSSSSDDVGSSMIRMSGGWRSTRAVRLQMLCDSPEAFVKGGSGSFAV